MNESNAADDIFIKELTDKRLKIMGVKAAIILFGLIFSGVFLLSFVEIDWYANFYGKTIEGKGNETIRASRDLTIEKLYVEQNQLIKQNALILKVDTRSIKNELALNKLSLCESEFLIEIVREIKVNNLININTLPRPALCQINAGLLLDFQINIHNVYLSKLQEAEKVLTGYKLQLDMTEYDLKISQYEADILKDKIARYSEQGVLTVTTAAEMYKIQKNYAIAKERYLLNEKKKETVENEIYISNLKIKAIKLNRDAELKEIERTQVIKNATKRKQISDLQETLLKDNFVAREEGRVILRNDIYEGSHMFKGDALFVFEPIYNNYQIVGVVTSEIYSSVQTGDEVLIRFPSQKGKIKNKKKGYVFDKRIINPDNKGLNHIHQVLIKFEYEESESYLFFSGDVVNIKLLLRQQSVISYLFEDFWEEVTW